MKLHIIAMRDIKANYWLPPIFVPNINAAIRGLADAINKPNGEEDWQRHPEDFELYEMGTWENQTGHWKYLSEEGHDTDFRQLLIMSTLKAN